VAALQGLIFDIRKFSLHDGPGIRTTVFLKGCPLSCWWCHNPEAQSAGQELMLFEARCVRCGACIPGCPLAAIERRDGQIVTDREKCVVCATCTDACAADARALVGRRMTAAEVLQVVERDRVFYDESGGGVTISGGEPLAQRAFLAQLLRACKEAGLHTALDTSGFAPWAAIDSIRADVDLFLYDLKLMDEARHRLHTGVSNARILSNLRALATAGQRVIVRVPVIPGINDDAGNLNRLAEFTRGLAGIEHVDLLPYHASAAGKYERTARPNRMGGVEPPTSDHMQALAGLLEEHDLTVRIGG
jgi:pyruvate formate lyase activating enzyme